MVLVILVCRRNDHYALGFWLNGCPLLMLHPRIPSAFQVDKPRTKSTGEWTLLHWPVANERSWKQGLIRQIGFRSVFLILVTRSKENRFCGLNQWFQNDRHFHWSLKTIVQFNKHDRNYLTHSISSVNCQFFNVYEKMELLMLNCCKWLQQSLSIPQRKHHSRLKVMRRSWCNFIALLSADFVNYSTLLKSLMGTVGETADYCCRE